MTFAYNRGPTYEATIVPPDPALPYSLANFYSQEDADSNRPLAEFLGRFFSERNVERVYAPSVAKHSGRIVCASELSTCIELPGGVSLFRNKEVPADGVPIRPKEAFVMSGAGCPVIVATARRHCIPMHASRDCLIDMGRMRGEEAREHESVIDAALAFLKTQGVTASETVLRGCFAIDAESFEHPFDHETLGASNRRLFEDIFMRFGPDIMSEPRGRISLAKLAIAQAKQRRAKEMVFTHPLLPHFATTRNQLPDAPPARNLVAVIRTA